MCMSCGRGSCYGVELKGYVVEHSYSKGEIIVRCLDLEGLHQSKSGFCD